MKVHISKPSSPAEYKPGDVIQVSGIYLVTHDQQHVQQHEVTCVKGKQFPPCNHCTHHPRFKLVHAALHVGDEASEHELFGRPQQTGGLLGGDFIRKPTPR